MAQDTKEKKGDKHAKKEVKAWDFKGLARLDLSQTALSNWAMGGENSLSGTARFTASLTHTHLRWLWQNNVDLEYGLTKSGTSTSQKSGDKIDLSSKLGYSITDKWYYTGAVDFKTQFYKGKLHPKEGHYTSKFMSPAYLNISAGIEYRPVDFFSAYLSPFAENMTFILDDYMSDHGYFGVKKGDKLRAEFGTYLKLRAEKEVMENVNVITKVDIFTPYNKTFGNLDIDWELTINLKINKLLSANVNTSLKYDDDVQNIDKKGDPMGVKVQFKETLSLGLSYSF